MGADQLSRPELFSIINLGKRRLLILNSCLNHWRESGSDDRNCRQQMSAACLHVCMSSILSFLMVFVEHASMPCISARCMGQDVSTVRLSEAAMKGSQHDHSWGFIYDARVHQHSCLNCKKWGLIWCLPESLPNLALLTFIACCVKVLVQFVDAKACGLLHQLQMILAMSLTCAIACKPA